jgi:hypothetical protein
MNKTLILASFVLIEKVDWYLDYLENNFNINKNSVFCYENNEDKTRVIITFKLQVNEGEFLDIKTLFPNTITIHKKGDALYTINALNFIINEITKDNGNIEFKSVKINWSDYQNKMLLTNSDRLVILNISRVF